MRIERSVPQRPVAANQATEGDAVFTLRGVEPPSPKRLKRDPPDALRDMAFKMKRLVFLALLALIAPLAFVACSKPTCFFKDGCFNPCSVDDDCADGEVCRQIRDEPEEMYCSTLCSSSDQCGPNTCRCEGDPASGFCDSPFDGPRSERPGDELCAADFNPKAICADLCGCPCSGGDGCPADRTGDECRTGCEGSYTSFPACAGQLDAYYECAYRKAVCVADADPGSDTGCPQNYPFCWGTSPEMACPDEVTAVMECTMASWSFFYPSPT
jgi:hypothetical protein